MDDGVREGPERCPGLGFRRLVLGCSYVPPSWCFDSSPACEPEGNRLVPFGFSSLIVSWEAQTGAEGQHLTGRGGWGAGHPVAGTADLWAQAVDLTWVSACQGPGQPQEDGDHRPLDTGLSDGEGSTGGKGP